MAALIVARPTIAAQTAKNATQTIPILFTPLGEPVGTGLVGSLARPGGNVTGMSAMFPEVAAKRLGLLAQAAPCVSRILVLTYLQDPIAQLQVRALQNAAHSLGVVLQVQDVRTSDELPVAFESGVSERAEGLLTTAESIFSVQGARVTDHASWRISASR